MKFEIYVDPHGKIRWRLRAKNRKVLVESSDTFNNEGNARRNIKAFRHMCYEAEVIVVKQEPSSHPKEGYQNA